MPSSIGHAVAALTIGAALRPTAPPRRFWIAVGACAVLPDVDAIGRPFGLGDIAWLGGHRGLTHALAFAAALGVVVVAVCFREQRWDGLRLRLWACIALATASHGVLDAMAVYGEGVTFLAPFSPRRYEAAWQPFDEIVPEIIGLWIPGCLLLLHARRRGRWTVGR